MRYEISRILSDVRIALDQNKPSEGLISDIDTLSINDIIEGKIVDAVIAVERSAPVHLLGTGEPFGTSVAWNSSVGYGSGHIVLPSDFMRLIVFQMSDWSRGVSHAISNTDPLYNVQQSKFAGVRGCPEKPVVAIVPGNVGLLLEFYSCMAGERVCVKSARYLPLPIITDGSVEICEKCYQAVIYYCAYLVCSTYGEHDLATTMLNASKQFTNGI